MKKHPGEEMGKRQKFLLLILLWVAFAVVGPMLFSHLKAAKEDTTPCDFKKIQGLLKDVNEKHLSQEEFKVDRSSLVGKSCIDGAKEVFSKLDPHSNPFSKRGVNDLKTKLNRSHAGLGVTIEKKDEKIVVTKIHSGTPAESLGMKRGDQIAMVNGRDLDGKSLDDTAILLGGTIGSWLHLVFYRNGERWQASTKRDRISPPTVKSQLLPGNVAVFKISLFSKDLVQEFLRHMAMFPNARGYVIDLRGNPGGIVRVSLKLLALLIEQGETIQFDAPAYRSPITPKVTEGFPITNRPLVVLVDRKSASASELLAGSLKDHKRAVIIGERTFGKGTLQRVKSGKNVLPYRLTIERFNSPLGTAIQGRGILPDIECGAKIRQAEITELSSTNAILASPQLGSPSETQWVKKLKLKCNRGEELKAAKAVISSWPNI
ncbi:S41 family peptidase [Bdellovibrionota bacterium]